MTRPYHAICIAGTHSGVGKTTITLGLLAALNRRGLAVQPFKCGPDYIDPGHHRQACGTISRNLDPWMMGVDAVVDSYARNACNADVAVVEGVMGLFDGASSSTNEGSSAHVASLLALPVILVVDARSLARSVAAIVHGYSSFCPELDVVGVIANNVGSERHTDILRESLESSGLPPLLGAIPRTEKWRTEERHLGLVTAHENSRDDEWFTELADGIEQYVRIDKLLALSARDRPEPPRKNEVVSSGEIPSQARLGVARDEAFQFYYEDNLDLLRNQGVEIVPFSPLRDKELPAGLGGLYIGGGYPEIHAERLSANEAMRQAIRSFAESDKPIYAECGGLMYLCDSLCNKDGESWPMCGVFHAEARMESQLRRLGYVEAELLNHGFLGHKGSLFRGHEFHWSDVTTSRTDYEPAFSLQYTRDSDRRLAGLRVKNVWASYIHLHIASNPSAASTWADAIRTPTLTSGGSE